MPPPYASARRSITALCALACAWALAGAATAREGGDAPLRGGSLDAWLESGAESARGLAARVAPHLPAFLASGYADLQRGALTPDATRLLASLAALAALLFAAGRLARGRGAIAVALEYPPGLRGTFRIEVTTHPRGRPTLPKQGPPTDEERALHESGHASARSRWGVSRETQFLRIPCRRHWVSVEGFVQTSESDDIVSWHFDEQEIRPARGSTRRLRFDFEPRACPVEVRVAWDRRSVDEARVGLYGVPGSLRLARGPIPFSLDRGTHRLMAGRNDRVAEVEIEVESFEPRVVVIDLAERDQILFLGCPHAVEPYLNGEIPTAARALERDGHSQAANRLLARFHEDHGRREPAARHYELAGDLVAAAELYQAVEQWERAARLFEQIGDDERAGAMFQTAGQLVSAGEAYSRADSYVSAVECFRSAGDVSRWIEALSKSGQHLAAAEVALERGDRTQAIQCLGCVPASDPGYPRAVVHLAEAYQAQGNLDLARRKLEDMMASRPEDEIPEEAIERLAFIHETHRDWERALEQLERLRMRNEAWPHLETRIEAARKGRSSGAVATRPESAAVTMVSQAFSDASRYEVVEELGRGGMGVVFRARDRRLGREVALKRLPDNIRNHPKAIELFLREARAAAALNHPNIVTLFDAAQEGDTFYMTMELLRGSPLQRILREKGRLAPGAVAKLGGQVARGLQYAHEQGVVHRDVKTANLFFTDKKVVKIMDFGLAKMVEEVRRSTTVIGGTPYYMAPEQSAGEQVDHRVDLYALGVTFFELLAGKVPFKEGDVAFHHRHTPPPNVRDVAPATPPALAELVAGLLEKRPADRIRSAGEVVRRLAEIARGL